MKKLDGSDLIQPMSPYESIREIVEFLNIARFLEGNRLYDLQKTRKSVL